MTHPHLDSDGDALMRDVSQPVNSHGLLDNCYYVTAAKLLNTNTDDLVKKTETMQIKGGVPTLDELSEFYKLCKLPHRYHSFTSQSELEDGIRSLKSPHDALYAVAFRRKDGSGHVIIAYYHAGPIPAIRYHDYQMNSDGEPAFLDVMGAVSYHLYY